MTAHFGGLFFVKKCISIRNTCVKNIYQVALLLGVLMVYGCAGQPVKLPESHQSIDLVTQLHTVRAVLNHDSNQKHLRIYLEGDGRAWVTLTQRSSDPTPKHSHWLERAIKDSGSVYLARPCQYIKTRLCNTNVWTDARFSSDVLSSLNLAIDQIKTMKKAVEIELIGFSGGAALALMIAAEREDVYQVQTVAGNLDPHEWARERNLSPLHGSLAMDAFAQRVSVIPQRHFLGLSDQVISPRHASDFIKEYNVQCAEIQAKNTTHNEWDMLSVSELNKSIACPN